MDVNPLSLGGLVNDKYAIIIPENTLLPTKKNDVFTTVEIYKRVLFFLFIKEKDY